MPSHNQINQRTVLRLIASGHATSQLQIARALRVPPNTIHGVIGRLLRHGSICLDHRERHGRGRPIQHYRLRPSGPVLVAQCLGSVWNAAVFADTRQIGPVHVSHSSPLRNTAEAVQAFRGVCRAALRGARLDRRGIEGIVLAINAIPAARGQVMTSSVLPWVREATADPFSRAMRCRVRLQHAVDTVIPELRARAAEGVRSLAVLNVGDGVSAHGQSVDRVWGVHQATPGEVGHIIVDPNGPRCGCGNRGCLEALISGPALLARVRRDVRRGTKTSLASALGRSPAGLFARLEQDAQHGRDAYAVALTREFLDRVAWAVSVVANMMAPDVVVLGGYGLEGRESWRAQILERARSRTLAGPLSHLRLEFSRLSSEDHLRELAASFDHPANNETESTQP